MTAGALHHLVLTPSTATIAAGGSQAYTAQGFDAVNNSLGDVTATTTFTITPNGSCTAASCTATTAGAHTVTGTNGSATGTASLTVSASQPSVAINDVSVTEGNAGSVSATFTVTLSGASSQTVTVQYATADGTAVAGTDYSVASGSLTFSPGQTSKTFVVLVTGDTLNEGPETYFVNLSSPVNATLARAQGTGAITDNDPVPSLRINDVSVIEGDSGTTNAVFTVVLSAASGRNVSVSYATANKGAMAGVDYIAQTGTLLFAPGTTAQTISVPVVGDTLPETGEALNLNLSGAVNATIADNQGRCTSSMTMRRPRSRSEMSR